MDKSRRTFIGTSLMGAALAVNLPEIVNAAVKPSGLAPKVKIGDNDVILFQGDSITDAGRNKDNRSANDINALGNGYALLATADLLQSHASLKPTVYNRGISGNKVHQLDARWQEDCIALKPNILSIMIGVNDYWHAHTGNYDGTIKEYRDDYRKLIERSLKELPQVKLIIGEPFAVNNVKAVTDDWFPAFDEFRYAAKEIANEYQAAFIPYQRIFDEASKRAAPSYWTGDGVHTTLAGSQLMAEAWLNVVR